MSSKTKILIIGGGTGGIMKAVQLLKTRKPMEVSIIEPADYHWYQPAWTLVGAGTYKMEKTKKWLAEVMPKGVN